MKFTLVFDPEEQSFVNETLLPLVKDLITAHTAYDDNKSPVIAAESRLLLYLSDEQVKKMIPLVQKEKLTFAILPHPDAKRICRTTGTETKLEKAVAQLRQQDEPIEMDLLFCNDEPVITSVVVGRTFQLLTSNFFGSISFWKKLRVFPSFFMQMQPFKVELTQKDESKFKTAVSGMVITSHKANSVLSGYVPGESHINEGMLHALLISPRSVMELIGYAFRSMWQKSKLPPFGAYIKTNKLSISGSNEKLKYSVDGLSHTSDELKLEVYKKALLIIPGRLLEVPENSIASNEVFKTQSLPSGEAAVELTQRKLPLIRRASTEEFKDLFNILRENARTKSTYLMLMVLSTSLATLGLFANSSPVVIGAMILAPLMSPIISLSMASLRQDRRLVMKSTYTILAGLGISFFFAVLITWITPLHTPNSEILARTNPNLVDLGIAVISGIAGAYAHAREEVAKTLAGVAIAVALVPPLATAGIGLGWLDWQIFYGALLLLMTNLAGMVLAGSITFMVLGFSPFRLATKGIVIWLVIVAIFSIPLALGFKQMLYEHKVVNELDGWQTEEVLLRDVHMKSKNPLVISIVFVTPKPLNDHEIEMIKSNIEDKLNQEVELEISIALKR